MAIGSRGRAVSLSGLRVTGSLISRPITHVQNNVYSAMDPYERLLMESRRSELRVYSRPLTSIPSELKEIISDCDEEISLLCLSKKKKKFTINRSLMLYSVICTMK